MELDRAEKPLLQMRKLLKNLPDDPAPGQVHKLRTRARKIEAVAAALEHAGGKQAKRLLKSIKPVRKAAGNVRDMDVLTGDLLQMSQNGHGDALRKSLVRLVEHLGIVRRKNAGDLVDTVHRQRKPARRRLKEYAKLLELVAKGKRPAPIEISPALGSEDGDGSPASRLMAELCHWPRLDAHNIHPFRLKVKELRYVLQLFPSVDRGFADALAKVKDEIGDWHDWQQLRETAHQVLDAHNDKALLAQMDRTAGKKLAHALAGAHALRRRYLHAPPARRKAS